MSIDVALTTDRTGFRNLSGFYQRQRQSIMLYLSDILSLIDITRMMPTGRPAAGFFAGQACAEGMTAIEYKGRARQKRNSNGISEIEGSFRRNDKD